MSQQRVNKKKTKIELDGIIYSINEEEKTASIIGFQSKKINIFIPPSFCHESNEYDITSISSNAFEFSLIKTIDFATDSKLHTIEEEAFFDSSIESITIPSELTNLKEGWCMSTSKLNQVILSPSNPRYSFLDEKMIIGKTSIEKNNFEILTFCVRDVKTVALPNFIKYISSSAFSFSSLKNITIPSNVVQIGKGAFSSCNQLERIEFSNDSKLEVIDDNAFAFTSIRYIVIPSTIIRIGSEAFTHCNRLQRVEFSSKKSLSQSHFKEAFANSSNENTKSSPHILIIGKSAFFNNKLQKIEFSSDLILNAIDEKTFAFSFLRRFAVPPEVTHIKKGAFYCCRRLQRIDFSYDSKLQTIDGEAFYSTSIRCISIPSEVTKIGKNAFGSCDELSIIEIGEKSNLDSLDHDLFTVLTDTVLMISADLRDRFFL